MVYVLGNAIWRLRIFLACLLFGVIPLLACGSFAPRPTPVPTNTVSTQIFVSTPTIELSTPTSQAVLTLPTATLPPEALPTPTNTPIPGTVLSVGQAARVSAPATLNIRNQPSTDGQTIVALNTGRRVQIVDGPISAEGYTWWKVDDRSGNVGWAADGNGQIPWLNPSTGEARPVDRAPQVGDRVVVSVAELKIRSLPNTGGTFIDFATSNQQYNVVDGPQSANGYQWYRIRSDDGSLEGWAADGDDRLRWLSPLE